MRQQRDEWEGGREVMNEKPANMGGGVERFNEGEGFWEPYLRAK